MCGYCGHGYGRCGGGMALFAGVLLLLISLGIWATWLDLTMFFAVMLIIIGLHSMFCRMHDCCDWEEDEEYEEKKSPKKRK